MLFDLAAVKGIKDIRSTKAIVYVDNGVRTGNPGKGIRLRASAFP